MCCVVICQKCAFCAKKIEVMFLQGPDLNRTLTSHDILMFVSLPKRRQINMWPGKGNCTDCVRPWQYILNNQALWFNHVNGIVSNIKISWDSSYSDHVETPDNKPCKLTHFHYVPDYYCCCMTIIGVEFNQMMKMTSYALDILR